MSFRLSLPVFLVYCSQREVRVRFAQPHQFSGVLWEDVTLLGGGLLNMYPHGASGPLHRAWSDCWGHRATRTKQSHSPCYLPIAPNAESLCQQCPPCHRGCLRAGNEQSLWIGAFELRPLANNTCRTLLLITWGVSANSCLCIHGKSFPYIFLNLATTLDTISNNTIWNDNVIADIFKSTELLDLKRTWYCVYVYYMD